MTRRINIPGKVTCVDGKYGQAELWQQGIRIGLGDTEIVQGFAQELNTCIDAIHELIGSRDCVETLRTLADELRNINKDYRNLIGNNVKREFNEGCLLALCRVQTRINHLIYEKGGAP